MSRKQKRQLELKGVLHRCHSCQRELKNPASIARGRGVRCEKKHQNYLRGLREMAARENG